MGIELFQPNRAFKKRLSFIEWCEEHINLSTDFVADPGPFRINLTPYMRDVYNALDFDSTIEEVTMLFGAQLGKTQMILNFKLFCQSVRPGTMLSILPTAEMCTAYSKQRLGPMLDHCQIAQEHLRASVGREAASTLTHKLFYGGSIMLTGAHSKTKLSSIPVQYLLQDEIDRYKKNHDGEGDPLELARKRTTTFRGRRKIVNASTPTIEGLSAIENAYKRSTKYTYYVPCPHCGHMQTLDIKYLTATGYACCACGVVIDDRKHKTKMLAAGEWRTKDAQSQHNGYFLNQLYAPYRWVTWASIYQEKLLAANDVEKQIVFDNTVLAITYQEVGTSAAPKEVKEKCVRNYDTNILWDDTIAITMSIDCQSNRVEYEIKGWLPKMCCYSIDYGIIRGSIGESKTKAALNEIIQQEWQTKNATKTIDKVLIDSGYDTADVYLFCNEYSGSKVSPIKGSDTLDVPFTTPKYVEIRRGGRKVSRHGVALIRVGSSVLKKQIYNHLNISKSKYTNDAVWRRMFFPPAYSDEFYEQLCAERLIKEYGTGNNHMRFKYTWKKTRERNEALDLNVYNLAAAYMLKLDKHGAPRVQRTNRKAAPQTNSMLDIDI